MKVVNLILIFVVITNTKVTSVPPAACFADFRSDDCGQEPVAVMYYWKPGSRCEVGLWRGCQPNINMFRDEYECVSTCIFTVRAMPEDYHNIFGDDEESNIGILPSEGTTFPTTESNSNDTTSMGGDGKTDAGGAATTAGDGGSGTGAAGTSGAEVATTPSPAGP